ncbi:MAG: DUF5384 family protein [Candidatus Paceibacterota bacterium]|jgi:hypothetical protein
MKKILFGLIFISCVANADPLADQIAAFEEVQQDNIAKQNARAEAEYNAEVAEQRRLEKIALEQQAAERKLEEKALQAKAAAIKAEASRAREVAAQEAAHKQAVNDERLRDKTRLQAQEDEERAIELEFKRAELQQVKAISLAKATRANELLDAELAEKKANIDVIQSGADATRNVSEGAKELQVGIGKGIEAEGKSWFK